MKKHKSILAAHKKTEKKPWDGLVKVVQNFFTKFDECIDERLEKWLPVHQAFMDLKKAEAIRKAEEEAEKQRAAEEAARKNADEAEARAATAKAEEEAAKKREEEARARAEEEEKKAAAAKTAAEAAAAEEKRIADKKRMRERAEKEQNAENLRAIRRHMKDVEKLNTLAEAGEASDSEAQQLNALIRPGGIVSVLASPVASSHLLDDDQKAEVEALRLRLDELRKLANAQFDAKERRRRATEAKKAAEQEAATAEERRVAREADEAKAEKARKAYERLQAEADAAKERQRAAKDDVREARADQREAVADHKDATKQAKVADTDADRAANRAGRIERRLEGTDADIAGPLRGDLGTTGSLTRRWALHIVDEAALRAMCGPLGEHFTEDALNGAAYRWMQAHQAGFKGERVEGALEGVVFMYQQGTTILT
jgi:hypothetical protein